MLRHLTKCLSADSSHHSQRPESSPFFLGGSGSKQVCGDRQELSGVEGDSVGSPGLTVPSSITCLASPGRWPWQGLGGFWTNPQALLLAIFRAGMKASGPVEPEGLMPSLRVLFYFLFWPQTFIQARSRCRKKEVKPSERRQRQELFLKCHCEFTCIPPVICSPVSMVKIF